MPEASPGCPIDQEATASASGRPAQALRPGYRDGDSLRLPSPSSIPIVRVVDTRVLRDRDIKPVSAVSRDVHGGEDRTALLDWVDPEHASGDALALCR